MVCEACEFSDHYQHIAPGYAVILNVDADHLDYFGTLENIIASFRRFASKASKAIIANLDDANTMKAVEGLPVRIITFGHTSEADYYPDNIRVSEGRTVYDLMSGGRKLTEVVLNIPGVHNVSNSLAAAAACFEQGVTPEEFARELEGFHGAKRRFEIHGENMGITIADDYAHHPKELEVTLQAAKTMHYNEVWAVFQPFTYSRTKMLMDDFARVLPIADHVVMSEIMGSREVNTYGVYTKDLADKIPGSVWFNTFEEITEYVMNHAKPRRPGDYSRLRRCKQVRQDDDGIPSLIPFPIKHNEVCPLSGGRPLFHAKKPPGIPGRLLFCYIVLPRLSGRTQTPRTPYRSHSRAWQGRENSRSGCPAAAQNCRRCPACP